MWLYESKSQIVYKYSTRSVSKWNTKFINIIIIAYTTWGQPRLKVGGGGKIGMLPSYFVLIKLNVIKCLFNYDNAIIIIYKMQVKFINQSKICLIVSLAFV